MSFRSELSGRIKELEDEIITLQSEVRKLVRQKDDLKDEVGYSEQIVTLKKRLSDLEIEKDKKQEAFDREKREVEHMVGLQRQRADFEREKAVREAELSVRESNLETATKMVQEKMDFVQKSLSDQIGYLKDDILKTVIAALPNVNVELGRELGNGKAKAEVEA